MRFKLLLMLAVTCGLQCAYERDNPLGSLKIEYGTLDDDRDGRTYTTVKIGSQEWMAENLNIGNRINGASDQSDNHIIEKFAYNDNESNADIYGGLYQWNEAMGYSTLEGVQGICPAGWHMPTDEEWKTLEMELGMSRLQADGTGFRGTDQGTQCKPGGASGFGALMTGYRGNDRQFYDQGSMAVFLSSTQYDADAFLARIIYTDTTNIERYNFLKSGGFCVRCIRGQGAVIKGTLTDARDGQTYSTVTIGGREWMAENLNVGTFAFSTVDSTPADSSYSDVTDNGIIEKYAYDNDTANFSVYGGLYDWNEAMAYGTADGARGICPAGWHIPTDTEWKTLEMDLGMSLSEADLTDWRGTDQGAQLKEGGTSGFEALMGGYRHPYGTFSYQGSFAYFWSSTQSDAIHAWRRYLYSDYATVYRHTLHKSFGHCIRCIRD